MMGQVLGQQLDLPQKAVILAEDKFNQHSGKTAQGVVKYTDVLSSLKEGGS